MTDAQWEKKLKIRTARSRNHEMDGENSPYEPTPYSVLERLADSGYLSKANVLVDYGCGKGRASVFLAHKTGCRVFGIDYNQHIIEEAEANLRSYRVKNITFIHTRAEEYEVIDADSFYFFNPFTDIILRSVITRILDSCHKNPRKTRLFFYYPTDDTVSLLMTTEELMFMDEIDCMDLFPGNDPRERILIFETN